MLLEQQPQPLSELAVLIASGAAIVTAIVAVITAIVARIENGRHWSTVDDRIKREADYAKERDTATRELLSSGLATVGKRLEDFTKSIGDRFDAQSQVIAAKLDAQESRIETNSASHEAALKAAEAGSALKIELAQSQITNKLGELRAAIEGKADSTTRYLVEQLKTELRKEAKDPQRETVSQD